MAEPSKAHFTPATAAVVTPMGGQEAVREMNLAHLHPPHQGQQNCVI